MTIRTSCHCYKPAASWANCLALLTSLTQKGAQVLFSLLCTCGCAGRLRKSFTIPSSSGVGGAGGGSGWQFCVSTFSAQAIQGVASDADGLLKLFGRSCPSKLRQPVRGRALPSILIDILALLNDSFRFLELVSAGLVQVLDLAEVTAKAVCTRQANANRGTLRKRAAAS